jgi:hypothetical protein
MFHVRDFTWLAVAWVLIWVNPALAQSPAKKTDPKAIAALIAQLGDEDFQKRQAATRSLGAIGRPALAALREAADKHDEAEVRRRAKGLVETIENSLENLLEEYKAYGLPLPPKDAPLVRFGSAKSSLGFLLKPGTRNEEPEVLGGVERYRISVDTPLSILQPERATIPEIDGWIRELAALAIQCKARGWDKLALGLLHKW